MEQIAFDARFRKLKTNLEVPPRDQTRSLSKYYSTHDPSCDSDFIELAELYSDGSPDQRAQLRSVYDGRETWELIAWIRGISTRFSSSTDVIWLRAALAIALIENSRFDYRDLIVSLVILRHGAERVGIDTRPFFDEALTIATGEIQEVLRSARDHAPQHVLNIIRTYGPHEQSSA